MPQSSAETDISPALERITLEMASNLHLGEVLQTMTDGLIEDLGMAAAFIWLLDLKASPPTLELAGNAGLPFSDAAIPPKVHWITEHRDHFCTNRLPTDGTVGPPAWLLENGLRALGGFPLLFRDEIVGVMAVFSREALSDRTFERLFFFARQAAVAIQNARLHTQVEELSSRLEAENLYLRDVAERDLNCGDIVGMSPAISKVLDQVEQVAPTDSTVLITGETGTGKELVALSIHNRSRRRDRSMVKVNCGAISAGLVESELFGHEKGAFTGAVERRVGRFELADGGTLFLDEVSELPPETQVKLLRALQEGEFERLGSSHPIQVNVRIIAATNRDPAEEVRAGNFRADLYYRLNVFPVHVPPLRDRLSDVPLITACVLGRISERVGKPLQGLSDETLERLQAYAWPGNVRELLNALERAAILSRGPWIEARALGLTGVAAAPVVASPAAATPSGGDDLFPAGTPLATLEEVQRRYIERVLDHAGGVIQGEKGAATILGLHPNTLRSRMQKLGIRGKA